MSTQPGWYGRSTFAAIIYTILWLCSALGAIAGGLLLATAFLAGAAPAQGAAAAMAAACAVIPYVIARAWEKLTEQ